MSLTVRGSGVAVYPPGATFGPRRLPDFEFVWLLQGTAEWRYDQGSITLRPHCLLLGRPGMQDSFRWDRSRPTRHAYLHFELVGQLTQLPDPAQWPLVRTLPDDDPLRPLLRYLLNLSEDRSRTHHQTVQEALRLLLTLFVQGPLPDRDDELPGIGPVAAFELLRLARAATLLTRSNLSVAAVAHDCGFANPYHFSRRFHHVYGQPPGRYRRATTCMEPSEPLAQAGLLALSGRIWRAT